MIELMVTVAILGVTAALAIKGLKINHTGNDARKVAAMLATAYRQAVAGGAVRDDIAPTQKARTQVEFSTSGGQNTVRVWKLVEDDLPAHTFQWKELSAAELSDDVEIYAVTATADTTPGQNPAASVLPLSKYYYPDGSAMAMTVYLRHIANDNSTRFRIVGMPLMPSPQVFQDW